MRPMNPITMLITTGTLAMIILGVRVGDVWTAVETGRFMGTAAQAETKETKKTETPHAVPSTNNKADRASRDLAHTIGSPQTSAPNFTAPNAEVVTGEKELLSQLSKRREELDQRARDLDTRENLIKVAETRVDQKLVEMETLRKKLEAMVSTVNETQAAQLDNLVKIYENMKPEEAAKILETLDMPVLLGVLQRMKPKSTAPIMAKMSAEKAKDVTVALTQQDRVPGGQ